MTITSTPTAAELNKASFSYHGMPPSATDVSLVVRSGECVVLCGPSGGGKTTLLRLLNGLAGGFYKGERTGEIALCGQDVSGCEPWELARHAGSVSQDPASQFFSSQLAGEVAFTCENLGYEHERVVSLTNDAIALLDLDGLRGASNDDLSSGQKQRVAIASALAPKPPVLLMDEPTANLDEESAAHLGQTIGRLKEQGVTLVIAEHRLAWLMDVTDRFVLVQSGRVERELSALEVRALGEKDLTARGLRSPLPLPRPPLGAPSPRKAVLEIVGMGVSYGRHRVASDVNLQVGAGDIVALLGKNGVGKTTIARVLAGLKRPARGTVKVNGIRRGPRALRRLVWFSPNDLRADFFTPSLQEEVMLLVPPTEENREHARRVLRRLDLWEIRTQHPSTLSGGQRQRLSIACALMSERPVLVLDEPTSGLDALNMRRVADALSAAAKEGRAIVVITHDNEFMRCCCTHAYELGTAAASRKEGAR